MPRANVYQRVIDERLQTPASRRDLFKKVSAAMSGRAVVTFFTSSRYPVEIDDEDCDMLQSVLQQTDLAKGLVLMVSSLGGDTLAAERIVNICRAYSGTNEYWALVPRTSASAGTNQSKDCPIARGTRALHIGRSVSSAAARVREHTTAAA
jgi:ClpP class serine protease